MKEIRMSSYNVVPMVIERSTYGERAYDIYSLLLRERLVMLGSPIDAQVANLVVAQLLWLNREDGERPIQMYISSPGGEMYSGFAIYDTMQQISAPVMTTAIGWTASYGTALLTAGQKGMRYALPNATIHMHQPHGGAQGQATDLMIQARESQRLKDRLIELFMHHTGRPRETIEGDLDRDTFFDAERAVEYGLIDGVLEQKPVPAMSNGHSRNGAHG
jgi:ATP-dependent Clp protease protease subunit